jgi:hypothetical protein
VLRDLARRAQRPCAKTRLALSGTAKKNFILSLEGVARPKRNRATPSGWHAVRTSSLGMINPAVSTQIAPSQKQILRYQELRRSAEKFVGQTFFSPIFKQMRQSPFKSELFTGGRGGEVFQSMLDGMFAERMGAGAAGRKLVDAIVERLDPATSRMLKKQQNDLGSQARMLASRGMK